MVGSKMIRGDPHPVTVWFHQPGTKVLFVDQAKGGKKFLGRGSDAANMLRECDRQDCRANVFDGTVRILFAACSRML